METMEILDFRIIQSLLLAKEHSVPMIDLARKFEEKKYTITRSIDRLEKKNLVSRDNRLPVLTQEGINIARRYNERYTIALNHLVYEGVPEENAAQDACCWALYCSDQMMSVLRASDEKNRIKHGLKNQETLDGTTLCKMFSDGTYFFPFVIYRLHAKDNNNISMANNGFENPCALFVDEGNGFIQLKIKTMSAISKMYKVPVKGKVSKVAFMEKNHYVDAEIRDDLVIIPASCLRFNNLGQGIGQILQGTVRLKMQCTCGVLHMPESEAIFTILI